MKHLIILLLSTMTWFSSTAQKSEERQIRNAFDNYKSAILNDKGVEAVKVVDSRTISYYSEILTHVLDADSNRIESLSLLDKLMVLTIRHRASHPDILSFDGTSLLIYAIENGMVGKNSVANNTIGAITIDGTFAKGEFIANGQQTPLNFHFYKEDEQWKIDLTALFEVSTVAFERMVESSEQNENDFLFTLLERVNGKKPTPLIWDPIR